MGNCLLSNEKKSIFIFNQLKNEYKRKKIHISQIGDFKPYQVFIGDTNNLNNSIINGLNSMCDCDIHVSIGNNPTRLILSYIDINNNGNYIKGQTFHIYKIEYKEISKINEITQYDIYNSIQDYIYINKHFPSNINQIVAI